MKTTAWQLILNVCFLVTNISLFVICWVLLEKVQLLETKHDNFYNSQMDYIKQHVEEHTRHDELQHRQWYGGKIRGPR